MAPDSLQIIEVLVDAFNIVRAAANDKRDQQLFQNCLRYLRRHHAKTFAPTHCSVTRLRSDQQRLVKNWVNGSVSRAHDITLWVWPVVLLKRAQIGYVAGNA